MNVNKFIFTLTDCGLLSNISHSTFYFLLETCFCTDSSLPYLRGSLSVGRLERRIKLLRLFKYAGIVW